MRPDAPSYFAPVVRLFLIPDTPTTSVVPVTVYQPTSLYLRGKVIGNR